MAGFADQRDSQCLPGIIDQTVEHLEINGIEMGQLLADTGYSSGEALKYLEEGLCPTHVPVTLLDGRAGAWYINQLFEYESSKHTWN